MIISNSIAAIRHNRFVLIYNLFYLKNILFSIFHLYWFEIPNYLMLTVCTLVNLTFSMRPRQGYGDRTMDNYLTIFIGESLIFDLEKKGCKLIKS